jgi:hypothetical protein
MTIGIQVALNTAEAPIQPLRVITHDMIYFDKILVAVAKDRSLRGELKKQAGRPCEWLHIPGVIWRPKRSKSRKLFTLAARPS